MDIIDQLYNSHVSAATLDALDKYRIHKDQALHGYHALKEQLTDAQAAAWIRSWTRTLTFGRRIGAEFQKWFLSWSEDDV